MALYQRGTGGERKISERGEFSAIGGYNQFAYVDPSARTLIVKLSANPACGRTSKEADNREVANLALLQAIARHAEVA